MNNSDTKQAEQLNETAVKCRFFAQYLGQEVFVGYSNIKMKLQSHHLEESFYNKTQEELAEYTNQKPFLELNCLSKITDEDAMSMFRGVGRNYTDAKQFLDDYKAIGFLEQSEVDYLRSKWYAVPFMQYSVEDLISFRWVQLI